MKKPQESSERVRMLQYTTGFDINIYFKDFMVSVRNNSLANHDKWLPLLPRICIFYGYSFLLLIESVYLITVKAGLLNFILIQDFLICQENTFYPK